MHSQAKSSTPPASIARDQLRALVDRIERVETERAELASDIREIYAEAKGGGFDAKIIRKIIALRRLDEAVRREEQAVLDLYLSALDMQLDLFIEKAAA